MDQPGRAEQSEGRTRLSAAVVCIHGVWMPRHVMSLVGRRLRNDHHYRVYKFGYASMRDTLDQNAISLADYIARKRFDKVHLVGHSLGGVVVIRMLALNPDAPVHRVVCMGSPLNGSRVAARVGKRKWGRRIVGRSIMAGVVEQPASQWARDVGARHQIGVIAGTLPVGLGRLTTSFGEANDGTVAVSETQLPGIKDHLCMPVNHTGLAMSKDVSDQVAAFLKRGEFLR